MEYLTLNQPKKSLNIRVNDLKIDGDTSLSGGILVNGGVGQKISSFYQYEIANVYPTSSYIAAANTYEVSIKLTVTVIGKTTTVDIPAFNITATKTGSSSMEIPMPIDFPRDIYSSSLIRYRVVGPGGDITPDTVGWAEYEIQNIDNVIIYAQIGEENIVVNVSNQVVFDTVRLIFVAA